MRVSLLHAMCTKCCCSIKVIALILKQILRREKINNALCRLRLKRYSAVCFVIKERFCLVRVPEGEYRVVHCACVCLLQRSITHAVLCIRRLHMYCCETRTLQLHMIGVMQLWRMSYETRCWMGVVISGEREHHTETMYTHTHTHAPLSLGACIRRTRVDHINCLHFV